MGTTGRRGLRWAAALSCAGLLLGPGPVRAAALDTHIEGNLATIVGRLSIEERAYRWPGSPPSIVKVPIFRPDREVRVIGPYLTFDLPREHGETELQLRGDFDYSRFVPCKVAATGTLERETGNRTSFTGVSFEVQRLECTETGETAGSVSPDTPRGTELRDRYACDRPDSMVAVVTRGAIPQDMDGEKWSLHTWLGADALMRSGAAPRWRERELHEMTSWVDGAISELSEVMPDLKSGTGLGYLHRTLEVEFAPEVRSALEALVPSSPRSARRLVRPLPAGLDPLCEEVCRCWISLPRNLGEPVRMIFSPTTNLIYALRRLRELSAVKTAGFVRRQPYVERGDRVSRTVQARAEPLVLYLMIDTTEIASGSSTRRFFEFGNTGLREVPMSPERATALGFELGPPPPAAGHSVVP